MTASKVWIVKEQMLRNEIGTVPMDYSPAMQWGDIEFITMHDMPMYVRSSVQEAWNQDVLKFAEQYDQQKDYIITTGQPMAIFCVGWVLGFERKIPRFLVWRREENKYRVVNFDTGVFVF
jgi:hypothetical protein